MAFAARALLRTRWRAPSVTLLLAGAASAGWIAASGVAFAGGPERSEAEKARCKASYEAAQILQREEHLDAARAELRVCRETCPEPLVAQCVRWEQAVEALVPTVRLEARESTGASVPGARATIDGQQLVDVDGGPVRVDPGPHVFRFERVRPGASSSQAIEVRVAVHAGERDHVVTGVFPGAVEPGPTGGTATAKRGAPTASFVLGGVGAVSLVTAAVLAIKGDVDRAALRSSCAPACAQSDVDAIRTTWWVAVGAAAVGVVSTALAIYLWPGRRSSAVAPSLVALGPGSLSVVWTSR